ncbi:hypothetical protein KHA94_09080 [Bacillus sp. FJAT-49705]|uniref:Uncharacterized protein n=1 Tax=Cytobacillus citreus TaxID=2833586 RepID=A0ABS5NTB5_9BACI|nr:hypothetical protein [Cytobacillus citreus]MBS4190353.1 hypothetical protein [Cytobacillus citreus]
MLFTVDFSILINKNFKTIHTAFIHEETVSACMDVAEGIKSEIPENKQHHVYIFIEE